MEIEHYAVIDGETVNAKNADPVKHKFIGTWRPPINPLATVSSGRPCVCVCGVTLWSHRDAIAHYQSGCFDLPQYVTFKCEGIK